MLRKLKTSQARPNVYGISVLCCWSGKVLSGPAGFWGCRPNVWYNVWSFQQTVEVCCKNMTMLYSLLWHSSCYGWLWWGMEKVEHLDLEATSAASCILMEAHVESYSTSLICWQHLKGESTYWWTLLLAKTSETAYSAFGCVPECYISWALITIKDVIRASRVSLWYRLFHWHRWAKLFRSDTSDISEW